MKVNCEIQRKETRCNLDSHQQIKILHKFPLKPYLYSSFQNLGDIRWGLSATGSSTLKYCQIGLDTKVHNSASNWNENQEYFLGVKAVGTYGWQPYQLHVPIILKSWSLNFLEPPQPVQTCNGTAFTKVHECWLQQYMYIILTFSRLMTYIYIYVVPHR
jgi:hypothetical protein